MHDGIDTNDPYTKLLWDAIVSVYDKHDTNNPLNHINIIEWVEAIVPAVKTILQEEIVSATHPEFGWVWRQSE